MKKPNSYTSKTVPVMHAGKTTMVTKPMSGLAKRATGSTMPKISKSKK